MCGGGSWILPLGLALPYAWRLAQCLRVYRDTGARPQLFNALKYSTAFPVIFFSAMKYQARPPARVGDLAPARRQHETDRVVKASRVTCVTVHTVMQRAGRLVSNVEHQARGHKVAAVAQMQ